MPTVDPPQRPADDFRRLLARPLKSDELRHLKFGHPTDPYSVAALYSSDGLEDGITTPNPELDGFLATLVLQDLNPFTLKRNGRPLEIPATSRGAFGLHDLRHTWSSGKYPVLSLSLVFSVAYLEDLRSGRGRALDLLTDRVDYTAVDATLHHLGSVLMPAFQNPMSADKMFVDHVVQAIGIYLLGTYGRRTPAAPGAGAMSYKQERLAKEFLAANVQNNVCLADVADVCGLSPSYFARSFRRTTGVSPYRWLTLRRIDLAKTMLETTEKPLADIAASCGFSDQSHFTRTFSRFVGLAPGAWRRNRMA